MSQREAVRRARRAMRGALVFAVPSMPRAWLLGLASFRLAGVYRTRGARAALARVKRDSVSRAIYGRVWLLLAAHVGGQAQYLSDCYAWRVCVAR